MSEIDGTYIVDRDATVLAYSRAERGGVDTCDCVTCRNFRIVREQAFPEQFLQLLDRLGIDLHKDGEVYHLGRLSPGRHLYAGWYHFVGSLSDSAEHPVVWFEEHFRAWMCRAFAPRLASLEGGQVVQLEFHAEAVPWLLGEPEPP